MMYRIVVLIRNQLLNIINYSSFQLLNQLWSLSSQDSQALQASNIRLNGKQLLQDIECCFCSRLRLFANHLYHSKKLNLFHSIINQFART